MPHPVTPADLVAQILHAGGTLSIPDPQPADRAFLRRLVHATRTGSHIPDDHRLQCKGRDKGDLILSLSPGRLETSPRHKPVPVPAAQPAAELHPAVRQADLSVCPGCMDRARRILSALATEAEQRGYRASVPSSAEDTLLIATDHEAFHLRLTESTEVALDPDSVQYAWQRVTTHTIRPSHHLDLHLPRDWGHRGRRHQWGDRTRWQLEDKLPHLLAELDHRTHTNAQRRKAQQNQEEDTRRQWQAAMERARTAFTDAHRTKILNDQVDAWHQAQRIRAYCDALQKHLMENGCDDTESVTQWINWAQNHAADLDPVPLGPGMPDDPTPAPQDLQPYLRGWSAYEPKRR
ncbi:hypothetical protein [Streptomyces sp. NPDC058548]|uniref:hypothetical protein n=1 Tax=Streptomyces sp. NPDC058548 TaxID=3346545 RepID=UPI003649D055